jgi:hypothetical protein
VRRLTEIAVPLLAILLLSLPVLACVQPGVAMTAAERACCKQMAQRCGDSGMARSHGCCHSQVSRTDWHALQSSLDLDHALVALRGQPVVIGNARDLQIGRNVVLAGDSPPGLSHFSISILRI